MLLWWRQKWGPIPPKPGPKSRSTCFERLGKMWVPKKRDLLNRWMIVLGGCFAILCTWLKKENRIVHNCFALLKWSAIFFSKTEGSGVDLLFYALDYSSLQDQDIVLVNPHLNIKMRKEKSNWNGKLLSKRKVHQLFNARRWCDHAAVLLTVASFTMICQLKFWKNYKS